MAVGDIYRLAMRWEHSSSFDDVVNVWHFRQEDVLIADTPAEDLLQAFTEEVLTLYSGLTSVLYTLNLITVRQVTGGIEIFETPASTPGARGTGATGLPGQLSCVVSWRTGLAGRSRRGRTYMPPAAEEDLNAGRFITGYLDGIANFSTAMITGMSGTTLGHSGWVLGINSGVPAVGFTPVTFSIADAVPGTMQSRRIGRGS